MNFDVNTPPRLTGKYTRDIPALHNWCSILHRKLNGIFQKGTVMNSKNVVISQNYVFIGNDENYIKFENGVLEVKTS